MCHMIKRIAIWYIERPFVTVMNFDGAMYQRNCAAIGFNMAFVFRLIWSWFEHLRHIVIRRNK